ncbi:MAG: hypothetical protein JWP82_3266 [Humibacillus sp.]|nr:hypothetical protein [Humibacillus sp.]
MRLRHERVPAGAAALVAVALAVPSVLAATWRLTTLDSQSGVVLFDERDWSWGRSQVLGAGGSVVQDLWNPFGLAVLVALLACAAVAAVAWVLIDASWSALATVVSSGALFGRLLTTVAERQGRQVRDDVHGLAASGASTHVGWLETASVVVLVAAIALLVLRLVAEAAPSQAGDDALPAADPTTASEGPAAPRGGRSARAGLRPDGAHLAGPEVGLSDER